MRLLSDQKNKNHSTLLNTVLNRLYSMCYKFHTLCYKLYTMCFNFYTLCYTFYVLCFKLYAHYNTVLQAEFTVLFTVLPLPIQYTMFFLLNYSTHQSNHYLLMTKFKSRLFSNQFYIFAVTEH